MSKADKMFEKLGYKKYEFEDIIGYAFEKTDRIMFKKTLKYIELYKLNSEKGELSKGINIKELQAINEKCNELGWL